MFMALDDTASQADRLPGALQALIQNFVRSTLTLTFVIAAARVVFNIKAQMMEERRWEMELRAEVTRMRRVEAVDKLLSVLTLLVASVFGLQAIGLDGASPAPSALHPHPS